MERHSQHPPLSSTCSHRCMELTHTTSKHEFTTKENIIWQFHRAREKFEDATLRTLKMEEETISQGRRTVPLRGWRDKITDSRRLQRAKPCQQLDLYKWRWLQISGIHKCHRTNTDSLPWYDGNWETMIRRIPHIWHTNTVWETTLKASGIMAANFDTHCLHLVEGTTAPEGRKNTLFALFQNHQWGLLFLLLVALSFFFFFIFTGIVHKLKLSHPKFLSFFWLS